MCQGKDPRRFAVVIAAKGALINYEVKGFNTFHFIKANRKVLICNTTFANVILK